MSFGLPDKPTICGEGAGQNVSSRHGPNVRHLVLFVGTSSPCVKRQMIGVSLGKLRHEMIVPRDVMDGSAALFSWPIADIARIPFPAGENYCSQ